MIWCEPHCGQECGAGEGSSSSVASGTSRVSSASGGGAVKPASTTPLRSAPHFQQISNDAGTADWQAGQVQSAAPAEDSRPEGGSPPATDSTANSSLAA